MLFMLIPIEFAQGHSAVCAPCRFVHSVAPKVDAFFPRPPSSPMMDSHVTTCLDRVENNVDSF